MKTFSCAVLVSLTLLVPLAIAQEAQTLKERLSDKASDAQRVDNCHVPVERRGAVPSKQVRQLPRADQFRSPRAVGVQLLSGGASGFSNSARLSIASP